nr:MAG TPA: hypothetical protein [Caudoviricetes sp.]
MNFSKIVDKVIEVLFVLMLLGAVVLLGMLIAWSIKMAF